MRRVVFILLLFTLMCDTDPVISDEVKRYNIFLILREDRDTQYLYLSKVYVIDDTIMNPVKANARVFHNEDTFNFNPVDNEKFISVFTPKPGELYTLNIEGECGNLKIEREMPEEFKVLFPLPGDTLRDWDTIKILNSRGVYGYEIKIGEHLGGPFDIETFGLDTVMIPFYIFSYGENSTLRKETLYVVGVDSVYMRYVYGDYFIGYDTLKDYYGIFTGMVRKRIPVVIGRDSID